MSRTLRFVQLALLLTTTLICQSAFALVHPFAPFNVLAAGPATNPQSVQLTGAPAGTYNGYTASFDWSAGADDPFSTEASLALVSQAAPNTAGATFYADPGQSPNSVANGNSRTLRWGGYFDTNYAGGDPLHFWYVQSFVSSTANWNNVQVTLFSVDTQTSNGAGNTIGEPTWRRPNTTSGLSNTGTAVPFEVVQFTVDTSGPYVITTDTSGNTPAYDGFLALYSGAFSPTDQLNNIAALNDDLLNFESVRSQVSVALTAGTEYFLVQTGFANTDDGAWTGTIVGPGLATIPEPTSTFASLVALAFTLRRSRRR